MSITRSQTWLAARAEQTPEAEAFRFVALDRTDEAEVLSYRQLYARANEMLTFLQITSGGLPPRMLIHCADARISVVALHACWLGDCTPIVTSPELPGSRVFEMARFAGAAKVLQTNDAMNVITTCIDQGADFHDNSSSALGVFTSGTSGAPRLAELSASALEASAMGSAAVLGVDPHDRWLAAMPMSHVGGIAILIRSMLNGTCVVLDRWRSAERLVEVAHAQGATLVSVVPTMLQRVVALGEQARAPASLRATLVGGAAADGATIEAAAALGWRPRRTYGLTEAGSQVTTSPVGDGVPRTNGFAIPGVRVVIRDADDAGIGEIVVQGATLFRGYRLVDGTLQAPPADGFATGDIGRMTADGLEVLARRDDLIVTGGENVYPAEVEAALRTLEGVGDCAVIGLPDAEWGQRVEAFVEPIEGAVLDAGHLRVQLRALLARFQVPRCITVQAQLPRTASGKIQRSQLRAQRLRATETG